MPTLEDVPHDELTAIAYTAVKLIRNEPGLGEQIKPLEFVLVLQHPDGRFGMSGGTHCEQDRPKSLERMVEILLNGLVTIMRTDRRFIREIALQLADRMQEEARRAR